MPEGETVPPSPASSTPGRYAVDEEMVKYSYSRCARYYDMQFSGIFKEGAELEVKQLQRVNLFKGWKVIQFINHITSEAGNNKEWKRRLSWGQILGRQT